MTGGSRSTKLRQNARRAHSQIVTEHRAGRASRPPPRWLPPRRLLTWICRRWPAFVLGPDL